MSDLDYKSVFVPSARDIVLQRVKSTIANKRPKGMGDKNHAGEIDEETHSLQRFLELACEGKDRRTRYAVRAGLVDGRTAI